MSTRWSSMLDAAVAEEPGQAGEPERSTAMAGWARGTPPHLYQSNQGWAYAPFGDATVGEAGSAPTSLCMVYVKATGSRSYTPAGFAAWSRILPRCFWATYVTSFSFRNFGLSPD